MIVIMGIVVSLIMDIDIFLGKNIRISLNPKP